MKKIKQATQIAPSSVYDDTLPAGATLESGSTNLQEDLNGVRSQIKRLIGGANWYDDYDVPPAGSDELVKVSLNDTTPGYLEGKIAAGSGISLSTANEGLDEDLTISCTVVNTDNLVRVSAGDSTANYLATKLVEGAGISLTTSGTPQTLTVASTVVNTDNLVRVSAVDGVSNYLANKLVEGANITLTPSGVSPETLTIAASTGVANLDEAVDAQGTTPVTSNTNILVDMVNNTGWVFRNSSGTARVSLLAGSTGLGSFTCAVQSFIVDNTATATFTQGITADSDDFPINIGATAGQIAFTGTGDKTIVTTGTTTKLRIAPTGILELDGGTALTFEDQYKAGLPIEFSKSGADWTDFNTLFEAGDVVFSLLRAIYSSAFVVSVDGTLAGIGNLETKIKGTQGVSVQTKSNELVVAGRGISNDFFGVLPTLATEAYTGWYFIALASGIQQIATTHFAGTSGLIQIESSASGSSGGIVRTSGRTAIGTAGELHATLRLTTDTAVSHTGIFTQSSAATPTNGLWATHEGTSIRLVSGLSGVYNNSSSITVSTATMYRIKISWSGSTATLDVFNASTGAVIGSASVTINAPTSTGYAVTHLAFRGAATAGVISYLDYICYTPLSLI